MNGYCMVEITAMHDLENLRYFYRRGWKGRAELVQRSGMCFETTVRVCVCIVVSLSRICSWDFFHVHIICLSGQHGRQHR